MPFKFNNRFCILFYFLLPIPKKERSYLFHHTSYFSISLSYISVMSYIAVQVIDIYKKAILE